MVIRIAAALILVMVGIVFIYFVANLIVKAVMVVLLVWVAARIAGIKPGRR